MADRDAVRETRPEGAAAMSTGRPTPVGWLPLLRRITDICPEWLSWKNVESALNGVGDVDAVAPGGSWDRIIEEFRRWAVE